MTPEDEKRLDATRKLTLDVPESMLEALNQPELATRRFLLRIIDDLQQENERLRAWPWHEYGQTRMTEEQARALLHGEWVSDESHD